MPQTEAGGDTGRVRCLYCGANNFPTSTTCWQCSRPLKAMPAASSANAPGALPNSPSPSLSPAGLLPAAAIRPASTQSLLAPKAAAALGMLFPFVGLPAGMIFLMLDDPRKTQLGWLLIGWSIAGTVLSVISLAVTLGPVWAVLRGLLPHPGGSAPPSLPGLPADGGEGIWLLVCLLRV